MKVSNKAIVAIVGCITVAIVACLLCSGSCLWALVLVIWLADNISD